MKTHTQAKRINAGRVADLLNYSTQQIDDNTLQALKQARETALSKQVRHRSVLALSTGQTIDWFESLSPTQWAISLVLVVMMGIAGVNYWQTMQEPEHDISRLDVAILTDDLPLEVFID